MLAARLVRGVGGRGVRGRVELLWTAAMDAIEAGDDPPALMARERLGTQLDIADPYLRGVSQLALAWISGIAGDYHRAVREASLGLRELCGCDEPLWTASPP